MWVCRRSPKHDDPGAQHQGCTTGEEYNTESGSLVKREPCPMCGRTLKRIGVQKDRDGKKTPVLRCAGCNAKFVDKDGYLEEVE